MPVGILNLDNRLTAKDDTVAVSGRNNREDESGGAAMLEGGSGWGCSLGGAAVCAAGENIFAQGRFIGTGIISTGELSISRQTEQSPDE